MHLCRILLLFVSTSALACPELSGDYKLCTSGDAMINSILGAPRILNITTKIVNKVTQFTFIYPQGEWKINENEKTTVQTSLQEDVQIKFDTTPSCHSSVLELNLTNGRFKNDGTIISNDEFELYKIENSDLLEDSTIKIRVTKESALEVKMKLLGQEVTINCEKNSL
ncbi:MAG: hypothetical protein HOE90_17715 [Bacteriovoracaceae bacterium]|jgi:hypothetical protein|nr:hypothetical protein [Bacteriovoracaceae bacterium]